MKIIYTGRALVALFLGLAISGCSQLMGSITPVSDVASKAAERGSINVYNGSLSTVIQAIKIKKGAEEWDRTKAFKPGEYESFGFNPGTYEIFVMRFRTNTDKTPVWSNVPKVISIGYGQTAVVRYNWDMDGEVNPDRQGNWEETASRENGVLRIINTSGADIAEIQVSRGDGDYVSILNSGISVNEARSFILENGSGYKIKVFKQIAGDSYPPFENITIRTETEVVLLVRETDITQLPPDYITGPINNPPSYPELILPPDIVLPPGGDGSGDVIPKARLWIINQSDEVITSLKISHKGQDGEYGPETEFLKNSGKSIDKDKITLVALHEGTYSVVTQSDAGSPKPAVTVSAREIKPAVIIVGKDRNSVVDFDSLTKVPDCEGTGGSGDINGGPGGNGTGNGGFINSGSRDTGILQVLNKSGSRISAVQVQTGGVWYQLTSSTINKGNYRNFMLPTGTWKIRVLFANGTKSVEQKKAAIIMTDKYVKVTVWWDGGEAIIPPGAGSGKDGNDPGDPGQPSLDVSDPIDIGTSGVTKGWLVIRNISNNAGAVITKIEVTPQLPDGTNDSAGMKFQDKLHIAPATGASPESGGERVWGAMDEGMYTVVVYRDTKASEPRSISINKGELRILEFNVDGLIGADGGDNDKNNSGGAAPVRDIIYTVVQIGGVTGHSSTKSLRFVFSESISGKGLTAADIRINGIPAAGKLECVNDMTYDLSITVTSAEPIRVKIEKTGFAADEITIPVVFYESKDGSQNTGKMGYTVISDGATSGIYTTMSLKFIFAGETPPALKLEDIIISGAASKTSDSIFPGFTKTTRIVAVKTKYQGLATVRINHPEVDSTPQQVMVFTGPSDENTGKLMVKYIKPNYSQTGMLRSLRLYDITGTTVQHILITSGSNPLSNGGYGVYDVPEGSYRMRYLIHTADREPDPESPGIMIRIKQGYITYLELSGNGEIPFAEIVRPLENGENPSRETAHKLGVKVTAADGQGKFWLYNMRNNAGPNSTIVAELYTDRAAYFSDIIPDATRVSWQKDQYQVMRNAFVKEMKAPDNGRYDTADLDAGVYWIRVRRENTDTWYSWDRYRWQPVFIFPGTQFNQALYYYNEGLRTIKYQD